MCNKNDYKPFAFAIKLNNLRKLFDNITCCCL